MFTLLRLLFFFFICINAWSADPPVTLYDEGTKQGPIFKIDCTGAGVTCSKSGITGTVNVAGGGPGGSPGGSSPQIQFNNGGSFDGVTGSGADTNGNIGIGTTGPITKLQVSGTATATAFSGPLTGNVTGNASTATALAANGGNCSGNNFALGVDASGVGECAQPDFSNLSGSATDGQIPNTITVDLAATVTTNANLTGNDVTSSGNAATLASQWKGWTDGGTNVYTSTTTDFVGIGTTTPTTTLDIVKQSTNAPLMVSSSPTGDGDYLIITTTGNVGIGTTGTRQKLEVAGTIKANTAVDTPAISNLTSNGFVKTGGGVGTLSIDTGTYQSTSLTDDNTLVGSSGGTATATAIGSCSGASNALTYNTGTNAFGCNTISGSSQWVTLATVGIGTTEPVGIGTYDASAQLEVVETGNHPFMISDTATGNGNVLIVTSAGNIGIGTTSPHALLNVKGRVGIGTITPYTTIAPPANGLIVNGNVGIGTWEPAGILIVSTGNVGIGTLTPVAGTAIMNGNVGIGTWSPIASLEVKGGSGENYFNVSSGNTGIGTTNNPSKLSVIGGVSIGTTTQYRMFTAPADGLVVGGKVGIGTWVVPTNNQLTILGKSVGIGTTLTSANSGLVVMNGNVGIGTWSPITRFQAVGIGTTAQQGLCTAGNGKIGTFVGTSFNGTCNTQ